MPTINAQKEELCEIIRLMPDEMTPMVSNFLNNLLDDDEEPLSDEELLAIQEADAEIAAGDFYTLEEFNRRMDALQ